MGDVENHALAVAKYMARTLTEREYRESIKTLEELVGRQKYREIHSSAIRLIGETYVRV